MIDIIWSKDNDTKTQCNWLNTNPLHQGNASNKNDPARVKLRLQSEVPSRPLVVDDPLLLPEQEVHPEICINWFLSRDTERRVCQNPSRVATLGRMPWQNKNKNYRGPHYLHGAAQRVDNCKQQLELFTKAMVRPRTRADHGHPREN